MEPKNRYWILDCILALTAIVLGTTALCSFAEAILPAQWGINLSVQVLICVTGACIGLRFAGFVWWDHYEASRAAGIRPHRELQAMSLEPVVPHAAAIPVVSPVSDSPAETVETQDLPEAPLVTSLTKARVERAVKSRRQRRRAVGAVAVVAS